MKKIILSENQIKQAFVAQMIKEGIADGNAEHNPYAKQIKKANDDLKKLVTNYGGIMVNINNGKYYYVYEVMSLSDVLGKRYCLCLLIKDNAPYGQIAVKPLNLFKPAYGEIIQS